jgi:hypothetical protein
MAKEKPNNPIYELPEAQTLRLVMSLRNHVQYRIDGVEGREYPLLAIGHGMQTRL